MTTHATTADVLAGRALWSVEQGDCLAFLRGVPADSLALVCCSPPYDKARTYGIGFDRAGQGWAGWLADVVQAALVACKGPVVVVCQGQTTGYAWTASPFLLVAECVRRGVTARRPVIYRRSGIPGSGGPDYFRCDHEYCLVFTRGGKLPWSDPTACGHPPKWGPGGEMSHRLADGTRVNQWGRVAGPRGGGNVSPDGVIEPGGRPSHVETVVGGDPAQLTFDGLPPETGEADPWQKRGRGNNLGGRNADGSTKKGTNARRLERGNEKGGVGDSRPGAAYNPPVLANPGDVIECDVGGGKLGDPLAHENEAPYPQQVPERFVLSFAPPGGVVCDPFSGSGTTGAVALGAGRRFVGCDLRPSQVTLSRKRIAKVTPPLPGVV